MIAVKIFQSGFDEKISIKVWLQKVKQVYIRLVSGAPSVPCSRVRFFNQGQLKIFQSRCD